MSTRSNIAIELPSKKVKAIYVHSDGYPYGVGKILHNNYSTYAKSRELFNFGDASYLDDNIESCNFYGRDWDRKIDQARTHRDEWMFMRSVAGDFMLEYLYLFKNDIWHVSEQKHVEAGPDHWDGKEQNLYYWTKYIPVTENREYIKYKDKHEKHAEVKMISGLGKMLTKNFGQDNISVQSFTEGLPKKN